MIKKTKGQVSIFIIIAVVLAALIAGYFLLKGKSNVSGIPADLMPVEEYYLSCILDYTTAGIAMLGESAGYIYPPNFVPGSAYMPSSNYLDFSGTAVPYWYYVSGNNIAREQVPSKADMEKQLERYLEENMRCDFSSFTGKGYDISVKNLKATATISDNKVSVDINSDLTASYNDKNVLITEHKKDVDSKLGAFYNEAVKIYNYEKENMFLEKYGLDVLYSYAPVNDVEMTCSPKVWVLEDVKNDIKDGLEANTLMMKIQGNYYSKADKYFITDIQGNDAVQFLYSKSWPTKIETQDENGVLIASPVGNQAGLGIMGFCYVPYHFVYDLAYPVLIQVYDNNEIFRFPVIVLIQGNKERQALPGTYAGNAEPELCRYKNTEMQVYTYNAELEPVEADISFKCFNQECGIGKTAIKGSEALLKENFPQCVNGFVIAKSEGYETKKQIFSTNEPESTEIILDKLYDIDLNLKIDDKETSDKALIYFESEDTIVSVAWPEQKQVKLSDGVYNISVYAYRNGSISIPATTTQKCVKIPSPGIMGIFGMTTEKCFDLTIPGQTLSNIIVGGGKSQQYITESELLKEKADISISSLPVPQSIDDLQKNYELLEDKDVYMEFK